MNTATQNFKIQKNITIVSFLLFMIKIMAWYVTHSVAVLTDALESIVNVIASLVGLYSIFLSGKPKDSDHPYGHGKIEFISAAIEGVLIALAGLIIIYKSVSNLFRDHSIHQLDVGVYLILFTAIVNYFAGNICVAVGQKNNSLALIASGKHLKSDTYTTFGISIGLLLIWYTGITWIDSLVAVIFALIILYTGFKIVKASVAGIMDEADEILLDKVVDTLNTNRQVNWIDLHNLRIIKYGNTIHLDCHLTVPWYLNVHEAHKEIDALSAIVKKDFGQSVELFVHSDGCLDFSCAICEKQDCGVRTSEFRKKIIWTMDNISKDQKHQIGFE